MEERESIDERSKRIGRLKGLIFHRALDNIQKLPLGDYHLDQILKMSVSIEGLGYARKETEAALEGARISISNTIADRRIQKYFGKNAVSETFSVSRHYLNYIGRIDRVWMGKEIEIIDFKTNKIYEQGTTEIRNDGTWRFYSAFIGAEEDRDFYADIFAETESGVRSNIVTIYRD